MSPRTVLVGWLATRLVNVGLLIGYEFTRGTGGDVIYFARSLHDVSRAGLAHTLPEYPLLAVALLMVPFLVALLLGGSGLFPLVLLVVALVTDGAFTAMLSARTSSGRDASLTLWLLAVPLLGGVSLTRLDLLVGVLVAYGALVAAQHPRSASYIFAVATAIKLWPIVAVGALVAASRRRMAVLAPFLVTGAGLVVLGVTLTGVGRVLSPLSYQSDRGLQIESIAATPALWGWFAHPGESRVFLAPSSRSVEISGGGASVLVLLSDLLVAVYFLALVGLWWRAGRGRLLPPHAFVWVLLASITGYLACGKVLSPQYLLWLLPVAAVGLALVPGRAMRRWAAVLLVASALTHGVYPELYHSLVVHGPRTLLALSLLTARNLMVVGLGVAAAHQAWRATGNPAPKSDEAAAERQDLRRSSPSVG